MAPGIRSHLLVAAALTLVAGAKKYDTSGGPKAGLLNVHIVPHTHDDAGWLKTVDQYYMGLNTSIQNAGVQYILDNVVRALAANTDRKFIYVEMAFFFRWWQQQDEMVRTLTRTLVKNGQLVFINGGWVMHCEGTPHYLDMIDQTTMGHSFLMEEFGVLPKIGWQIDPFGHSATQAALLSAEVGFQGLFFGRLDYQDLEQRLKDRAPEFIWRASPSLGPDVQVFTGLSGSYGGNYQPPPGFCWDTVGCQDEPFQDDETLEDYNVPERVEAFVQFALTQGSQTRGEHIMMTMGSDFQYEAAFNWFKELDKLIHYVNKDGRVNIFYSTPEIYVAEKAKEQVQWPLKLDDFFPYADGPHHFWTGYLTSRPNLKGYVRSTSAFFQVTKQLLVASNSGEQDIGKLAEAMAILQHHDAVAGTAKQHTSFDYAKRLAEGTAQGIHVTSQVWAKIFHTDGTFSFCPALNVSLCEATQSVGQPEVDELQVVVWNGLAQERTEIVELPVSSADVEVADVTGESTVEQQLVASLASITDYGAPGAGAQNTLLFKAELPAMGFRRYRLIKKPAAARAAAKKPVQDQDVTIQNDLVRVTFCADTSRICRIALLDGSVNMAVDQDWYWYKSSVGNEEAKQASGAYIFRPNVSEAERIFSQKPALTVVQGDLVSEVVMTFGDWIEQRVRLAQGERHVEITYTVGGIPIDDGWGREVVSRFTTTIANDGTCYTDSNGREMLQRKKDYRPSWSFQQTEPVAGNYFPVSTTISIKDATAQLTVLTDRNQAGTGCVNDGQLELMVHRRLLKDDDRGVVEPLNETQFVYPYVGTHKDGHHYGPALVTRGRHVILLSAPTTAAAVWRPLQDRLYIPAATFYSTGFIACSVPSNFTMLSAPLPPNVQLISLTPMGKATLIRLAHQFGLDEDPQLSQPATVDLQTLFKDVHLASVEELGLTAVTSREEVLARRIQWNVENETSKVQSSRRPLKGTQIELGPLEIRTFKVTFAGAATTIVV